MEKKELKELKKIASDLKPQFIIGKNKITPTFIETIDKYLDAHGMVKIKALSAQNKTEVELMANEIAQKTESEIIDKKGFTFVLYR